MKKIIKQKTAQHVIVFLSAFYCGITLLMPDTFVGTDMFNTCGILLAMGIFAVPIAGFGEWLQAVKREGKFSVPDIIASALAAIGGGILYLNLPGVLFPYLVVMGAVVGTIQIGLFIGIDMRQVLVRAFFLDYSLKIFRHGNSPRASLVIMPLMIANGLCVAYAELNPYLLTLLFFALWFGFVYGRIHPLTPKDWPRLTDFQKWQYGKWLTARDEWASGYTKEETAWFKNHHDEWSQLEIKVKEWLMVKWFIY
jgi:hypothetical protein